MAKRGEAVSEDALADIAYLARSSNRIKIINTLATGPHTSRDVEEVTEVSRSTLERILSELEERGWAERTAEGAYVVTPAGEWAVTEFAPLVEAMQAIRTLGDAVAWLPTDELSIGLHHLSDAYVKRPENDDPMEIIDYFADEMRNASKIQVLTHLTPPEPCAKAMRDGFVTGQLSGTFVLTGELVEYLGSRSAHQERWRECIEAGADVSRYEGDIPCNLIVVDDTVHIKSSRPGTVKLSYAEPIVSENETVRAWANDMIDSYRDEADHNIEAFAEDR